MKYTLLDRSGNEFSLNGALQPAVSRGSFTSEEDSFEFEHKIIERSYLPGSIAVGEPRVKARDMVFTLMYAFQSDPEFNDFNNELTYWLQKAVKIQDVTNSKEAEIVAVDVTTTHEQGSVKRSGSISITMTFLSAYWQDITFTEAVYPIVIGTTDIAVTNAGWLKAYPILEFNFPSTTVQLDIYLDETKEGLQLVDPTLGTPNLKDLVINCEEGTLAIGGFDRTQNITDRTGYFPFYVGANTLKIESPSAGTLTLKYKKRYFV